MESDSVSTGGLLAGLIFMLAFSLLPSFVARIRKHRRFWLLFTLNICLSLLAFVFLFSIPVWQALFFIAFVVGIPWIACFAWAIAPSTRRERTAQVSPERPNG